MSPTLIATIAGLATALCWGTSDWLAARSTKKLSTVQINFVVSCMSIVVSPFLLIGTNLHMPTHSQLLTLSEGSALITVAYLLFVKALSYGLVGVIVPIGNSYPLVTVTLSVIFLAEVFTGAQFGAMLAIIIGAALLAYQKNHGNVPMKQLHTGTMLAIAAAITWGAAFFVLDRVVDQVAWQTIFIVVGLVGFGLACATILITERSKVWLAAKESLSYKPVIVTGLIGNLGALTFYLGSNAGKSIIIPTVLSSTGPLVASIWGAVIDKERIGALKRVGAVLVVAGIIVLNAA